MARVDDAGAGVSGPRRPASGPDDVVIISWQRHSADRPSWDCRACGKPWPCEPARAGLLREHGLGAGLAMLGWAYLEEAASDLSTGSPADLFERFIRWTR
jgi:hypothetical protein